MRSIMKPLLLLTFLTGCGGVEIILKSPVESKCSSSGLKGCPELTEGVLLYVKGEEQKGKDELIRGAAANAPADVKKFAKAIKQLKNIPGASKYTAKLVEVASILSKSTAGAKAGASTGGGAAGGDDDDDLVTR